MQQGKARSHGKGARKKGAKAKDWRIDEGVKAKEWRKAKDSLYYNSLNTNVLHGGIEETERGSKLIDAYPTRHTALVIWVGAVKGH